MKVHQLIFGICLFLSFTAYSQNNIPDIPIDYSLKAKEDYKPYEAKVLELLQWLEDTPIGKHQRARGQASQFIFDWINGCPYVHMAMHSSVLDDLMREKHPQYTSLMLAYAFGMVHKMLKDDPEKYKGIEVEIQQIGIQKMIAAYEKTLNRKRSKAMEKFIRLERKGKLKKWVKQEVTWEGNTTTLPTQEDRKKDEGKGM